MREANEMGDRVWKTLCWTFWHINLCQVDFYLNFYKGFVLKKKKGFVLQDQMSLLLLFIVKNRKQGKQVPSYLGKFARVGTWQERWNTLGHFSQHRSSPPFWQTAHQSSLGSSSFLVSPTWRGDFWEASSHSDFPFEELSWWSPGWSPVLSGHQISTQTPQMQSSDCYLGAGRWVCFLDSWSAMERVNYVYGFLKLPFFISTTAILDCNLLTHEHLVISNEHMKLQESRLCLLLTGPSGKEDMGLYWKTSSKQKISSSQGVWIIQEKSFQRLQKWQNRWLM